MSSFGWRWFLWGFWGWFVGQDFADKRPEALYVAFGRRGRAHHSNSMWSLGLKWQSPIRVWSFGRPDFLDHTTHDIFSANGLLAFSPHTKKSALLCI